MATPAEILAAGGLTNADLIVQAATATGIPLAIAAAMIQKESGGKNVYGHDGSTETGPGVFSTKYGPVTIKGVTYVQGGDIPVTQANFAEFLRRVTAGEKSNGVGPAQLTYAGYFKQYPTYEFWDALANIKFGLTIIADYLDGDTSDAAISAAGARYNGGTNPGTRALAYGADLLTKTNAWRAKLAGASDIGGSGMDWVNLEPDLYRLMNVHYTSGRAGRSITKIVLHHNGGALTTEQCYQVWQTREASAHYQVEITGRIGQLVNDSDTAWHAGNQDANQTSIGIEHANNALAPNWTVSDATLDAGAHLVAALCRYYNLGRPAWGQNVFGHKNFYATDCPGALAGTQNAAYMARASYYYDNLTGGTPSDTTATPSEEEDIMSDPQVIELLTQISRQTLGSADALTRGQSGIKWDGDAYRHLAIISDALTSGYPANPDAGIEERPEGDIHRYLRELAERTPVEPERAEPEPAEPDASKEAIKTAVTAIRAAADAIEAQL